MSHAPAIEIRLATASDLSAIVSVLLQSFEEYRPLYTAEGFAATTPDETQLAIRMSEGPLWTASLDKEIVGTVAAVVKTESLYIRGMAVLPSARGHRLGQLLLQEIEAFANTSGCVRIFLSTTPFLHRAIALYERHGFKQIDDGPNDLYGTPLFTMEKALGVFIS